MATSERGALRDLVRRIIRDEKEPTSYNDWGSDYIDYAGMGEAEVIAFADAELDAYLGNAIRAYSQVIPREVSSSLALTAGQKDYDLPEDCREIVAIQSSDGATDYAVTKLFAGKLTIDPTPTAADTALFEYRGVHTIPTEDTGAGSTSSFDPIDEPLIVKHVVAQCWETLAGEGARYYLYHEGDVEEDQGKTQKYYRDEADRLYKEFAADLERSAETLLARRPVPTSRTMAGIIARKPTSRGASIYKTK